MNETVKAYLFDLNEREFMRFVDEKDRVEYLIREGIAYSEREKADATKEEIEEYVKTLKQVLSNHFEPEATM